MKQIADMACCFASGNALFVFVSVRVCMCVRFVCVCVCVCACYQFVNEHSVCFLASVSGFCPSWQVLRSTKSLYIHVFVCLCL